MGRLCSAGGRQPAHETPVDLPPFLNQAPCGMTAFRLHQGATSMSSRTSATPLTRLAACLLLCGLTALAGALQPQQKDRGKKPDFIPSGYDDYQNMLDQLGIMKVRKGRDARVKDTSDEATANPYKDSMPDLMTFR